MCGLGCLWRQYLRWFAEPARTLTLGPHDGAGMCGRYVRWYTGDGRRKTVLRISNGVCANRYLGLSLPNCTTRLPYSGDPAQPMGHSRRREAAETCFVPEVVLVRYGLLLTHHIFSAGGVTKPSTPTNLTALSLGCYYLLPCDNAPSVTPSLGLRFRAPAGVSPLPPAWFRDLHGLFKAWAPCVEGAAALGRNQACLDMYVLGSVIFYALRRKSFCHDKILVPPSRERHRDPGTRGQHIKQSKGQGRASNKSPDHAGRKQSHTLELHHRTEILIDRGESRLPNQRLSQAGQRGPQMPAGRGLSL